jgi:class 3 adenylate cyclase
LWLQAEGFASASALRGGLIAWEQAGYPTVPFRLEQTFTADEEAKKTESSTVAALPVTSPVTSHAHTFLSGLVEAYAAQQGAPVRKELTVLFVDIAESTVAVATQLPETTLAQVQHFMEVVTEIALAHCGDVKDYEGDGALLYFDSVVEAAQATLAIRQKLARTQEGQTAPVRARFSLNVGDVVIGVIGTALRRSVALIGPSINLAARLLKQIPPGGIIATDAVVEHLRRESPELAARFVLWKTDLELKGFTAERVTAFHVP